ncbi:hypothetical protein ACFQNF_10340 [Iodobacter arcticus]|uniref:Type IV pilus modification protein PilV n=1 Tax=Iodobacter arcticus TaxID=590593 RepID=A0ABW2QXI1_9NEIS
MSTLHSQRGSMLLECLVGISIFSFGVLALSALQANAMRHASSSSTRTTATQLIQRLDGEMRSNITNLSAFQIEKTKCKDAAPSSDAAKRWAQAVSANLSDATCSVAIQANDANSTPCSRRATVSISWPVHNGAKTAAATGENKGLNQAVTTIDIPTILETNDPLETRHLRCGL